MRLNLGPGREREPGVTTIDRSPLVNPDILHDLAQGMPLCIQNDSVDEIVAHHIFEHLADWERLLVDCWRVLKRDGILRVKVPNAMVDTGMAFTDPTHVRYFTPTTMLYFTPDSPWNDVYGWTPIFRVREMDTDQPECRWVLEPIKP